MTTALYPGSFDPVTNGHADIAMRAAALFDKVVVGVFDLPQKRLMFSLEERVSLFAEAVKHVKNIEVKHYSGLTVTYAKTIGAKVIVRGLRMSSDFEHEFEMALMNKKIAPDIEVVSLMSNLAYQFVSSSLLKEVAQFGGNLNGLVPPHVAAALKTRFKQ